MSNTLAVSEIVVPEAGRRDLGNVLILAGSIERVGLLHPLVVNTRRELIAGRRRLAAVKMLNWERVPVRVVGSLDDAILAIQAERDENTCREPLTVSEVLEIGARLEALEKPEAAKRKGGGRPPKKTAGKLPAVSRGDTRDKVASALGIGGKTYEKAKKVAEAARREPERYGDLPAVMEDRSVDAAFRELRARESPAPIAADPEPVDTSALMEARRLIAEFCDDDARAGALAPALACLDRYLADPK